MFTVGVLTISDKGSRGEREDLSGPEIRKIVENAGGEVSIAAIIPDERILIEATLRDWADERHLDLILTTGGTGLSARDVTPEATRAVIDREVPGIAEAMRLEGLKKTPHAMLSRAMAGTREKTLIVNLPGSPKGVRENLQAVIEALPHAIDIIKGTVTEHKPS
jgi:molybdenum cofactor synthesis domain-containing protein